jgi:hypothetical protein
MLQCERDRHGNTSVRSSGSAVALVRVFGKTMSVDFETFHSPFIFRPAYLGYLSISLDLRDGTR